MPAVRSTDKGAMNMRMWMINPKLLCHKHLNGEHADIHKHRHNFESRHRIDGRIEPVVKIEPDNMKDRHDEIVKEFERRGWDHNSPFEMPDISYLSEGQQHARVTPEESIKDLIDRCDLCAERILLANKVNIE